MKINFIIFLYWLSSSYIPAQCIDSTGIRDSIYYFFYCIPHPFAEEFDYTPVCGCDSMSYINIQCARAHGIAKHNLGGGCYCKDIRVIDPTYSMEKNPFKTPSIVCGCDGKNYRDPYEAYYKFGITKFSKNGACSCEDSSFIDTSVFLRHLPFKDGILETSGCTFDLDKRVCGCNGVSYISEYEAIYRYGIMNYTLGSCPCGDSLLINLNFNCDTAYEPVCGCDHITYDNACIAKYKYGIIDIRKGPCSCYEPLVKHPNPYCYDVLFPRPSYVCGCDSITYRDICLATCLQGNKSIAHHGICRCPDQTIIDNALICSPELNAVCGCDGKSYRNLCIAEKKHGVFAAVTTRACTCRDNNLMDLKIECHENHIFNPVCGCDSITYRNPCVALNYYGVSEWTQGPCKFKCKDPGLVDTNKLCLEVYQPVCGCDLITYQNECIAKFKHGISSWTPGECSVNSKDLYHLSHQLYPNPAVYNVYMTLSDDRSEEILLDVFAMNGKSVFHNTVSPSESMIEIDLQLFSQGLYIYTLTDQKGRKVRGKFLKS